MRIYIYASIDTGMWQAKYCLLSLDEGNRCPQGLTRLKSLSPHECTGKIMKHTCELISPEDQHPEWLSRRNL